MRKIILVIASVSFVFVLVVVVSYFVAIAGLGVGSKPDAVAVESRLIYVYDSGVRYPGDCWCFYANKTIFKPLIWIFDTDSWRLSKKIESTDSDFDSKKNWILEQQNKRFVYSEEGELYESHRRIIDNATNSRGPSAFGLSSDSFVSFESDQELLVIPKYIYALIEDEQATPVVIAVVDKENYQTRKLTLRLNHKFQPGHYRKIWADNSNIVYIYSQSAHGEKPGGLTVFDPQNGQQEVALELDAPINKFIRPIVSIGNFYSLFWFFGIIIVPVLLIIWGLAIKIVLTRK